VLPENKQETTKLPETLVSWTAIVLAFAVHALLMAAVVYRGSDAFILGYDVLVAVSVVLFRKMRVKQLGFVRKLLFFLMVFGFFFGVFVNLGAYVNEVAAVPVAVVGCTVLHVLGFAYGVCY
jgi:hypothetical protein